MNFKRLSLAGVALLAGVSPAVAQPISLEAGIAPYAKTSGVSGSINSIGSDTMNNLMTLWAEGFLKHYPSVKVQVEGKGRSTAPAALIAGTAQFGPMSREMRASEIDQFEKKYGYKPTVIRTSLDALAIFVHKDNPLSKITLAEADAAFSKSRRRGHNQDVRTWDQLGLSGEYAKRPLSLYGRNSASGTYGFFKEHTLNNGDFKDTVKEQPGSASVVQGVTADRFGIGYSGIGYKTSGVKALAIGATAAGPFSDGSYADILADKYPLKRYLYVYINRAPGKPLDPLVREFVKYMLSKEGQEVVVKDGYLPLPAKIVKEELAKIQ
jgi:phosphate transport system substrate-binding protein